MQQECRKLASIDCEIVSINSSEATLLYELLDMLNGIWHRGIVLNCPISKYMCNYLM